MLGGRFDTFDLADAIRQNDWKPYFSRPLCGETYSGVNGIDCDNCDCVDLKSFCLCVCVCFVMISIMRWCRSVVAEHKTDKTLYSQLAYEANNRS